MNSSIQRIGIDIDGVVRNLYDPLISCFKQEHPKIKIDPIKEWINYKIWNHFILRGQPVDKNWFKSQWFERYAEECYLENAFPYPYVAESLKHLKSKGYKIIFISAQPNRNCMGLTVEWLGIHKIPFNEIHFTDYWSKDKVNCDLYIEDSPIQFSSLVMAHKKVFIYDQPWNRNIPATNRFISWIDIVKEINRLNE